MGLPSYVGVGEKTFENAHHPEQTKRGVREGGEKMYLEIVGSLFSGNWNFFVEIDERVKCSCQSGEISENIVSLYPEIVNLAEDWYLNGCVVEDFVIFGHNFNYFFTFFSFSITSFL